MREIKFRAWNKLNKKMIWGPTEGSINSAWVYTLATGGGYDDLIQLMQFTGFKDKWGNEIYESDILEIRTQSGRIERFTVVYGIHRRFMQSGWEVDISGFAFVDSEGFPTFPIVHNYLNGHDLDIIEVIGNIHEHPHLIKK